ncbi:hypothetical protein [Aliagarivorans taiwanensis]|uniref:hypothetical protein n=1 Tax=Aliagarivorans taiwanensis TaxID=561966 RepID=UPI000409EA91|nr:hypothetical protein [Aliagarivorans taiwanensis]
MSISSSQLSIIGFSLLALSACESKVETADKHPHSVQVITVNTSMIQSNQRLCLPRSALTEMHGLPLVYLAEHNQAVPVVVDELEVRAKQACIRTTIQLGQKVILAGNNDLKPYSELGILIEAER